MIQWIVQIGCYIVIYIAALQYTTHLTALAVIALLELYIDSQIKD